MLQTRRYAMMKGEEYNIPGLEPRVSKRFYSETRSRVPRIANRSEAYSSARLRFSLSRTFDYLRMIDLKASAVSE